MQPTIFIGPSWPYFGETYGDWLDVRPPARRGDVASAVLGGATTIALVDGSFETYPAVWHKEILFSLSRGIPVYGAASLGALRAAELDVFGMRGVGIIYQAYVSGSISRDDAVMVLHAPRELGYQPVTENLFDLYASVIAAKKVISEHEANLVMHVSDKLYYKERTWERIGECLEGNLPAKQIQCLINRLRPFRQNVKGDDVRELVSKLVRISGDTQANTCQSVDCPMTKYLVNLLDELDRSKVKKHALRSKAQSGEP